MSALVHGNVRSALRTRLQGLQWVVDEGEENIAWEGTPFEKRSGKKPYIREMLKPRDSKLIALSKYAPIRHEGLYLIDVFVQALFGLGTSDTIAGQLLEHFAPNLQLTYGGQVVTVRSVFRSPPLIDAQWIQAPVTVQWYADTTNVV